MTNHFNLPLVTVKPEHSRVLPLDLHLTHVFGWLSPEQCGGPVGCLVLDPDTGVATEGFWPVSSADPNNPIHALLPARARCWRIAEENVEPYDGTPARIAELEATITGLRADLEASIQRTNEAKRMHQQDIETISERLAEETVTRGWTCGEVERVVDDVNQSLHVELTSPERDVDVDVSGYLRVPFTTTVTIRARIVGDDLDDTAMAEVERLLRPADLFDEVDKYDAEIEDDMEATVR